jgi:hypothetical protein
VYQREREREKGEGKMNGMVLHCGGFHVTEAEAFAVPVAERTKTWVPVSNRDLCELSMHRIKHRLGADIIKKEYALNQKGQQFFARYTLDVGHDDYGLSWVMRNSGNKSSAVYIGSGKDTFACDNMQMTASGLLALRRHTANVWDDLAEMVERVCDGAIDEFQRCVGEVEHFKTLPCSLDRGYEVIGRAMGHQVLTPQQGSLTLQSWKENPVEEHRREDYNGLWNAFTQGTKRGAPDKTLASHIRVHDFFTTDVFGDSNPYRVPVDTLVESGEMAGVEVIL